MDKSNQNEVNKKEHLKWTARIDDFLIEASLQQQRMGNRVDGTFTTIAYDKVLKELKENLEMDLNKNRVKNRMKTLKSHFNEWYDIFKATKFSGFS